MNNNFNHIQTHFCVIEINIGLYKQTLCTLSQNLKENNSSHQLKECNQTKGKQKNFESILECLRHSI